MAQFVKTKLENYRRFVNSVNISEIDEEISALKNLSINEKEEELIEYCQHYSILYRYRNYLVHEARSPGGTMQSMAIDQYTACYHQYVNDERLHLLYPVGLMKRIVTNSVELLREYLKKKQIDPYERVEDVIRF